MNIKKGKKITRPDYDDFIAFEFLKKMILLSAKIVSKTPNKVSLIKKMQNGKKKPSHMQ